VTLSVKVRGYVTQAPPRTKDSSEDKREETGCRLCPHTPRTIPRAKPIPTKTRLPKTRVINQSRASLFESNQLKGPGTGGGTFSKSLLPIREIDDITRQGVDADDSPRSRLAAWLVNNLRSLIRDHCLHVISWLPGLRYVG